MVLTPGYWRQVAPESPAQPAGDTSSVAATVTEQSTAEESTKQAVKTIACGTPDANGVTVATTLVCFSLLHTGLRMRTRIRRSARPHFEGGTNESFGRPRAVITTGVMAHGP